MSNPLLSTAVSVGFETMGALPSISLVVGGIGAAHTHILWRFLSESIVYPALRAARLTPIDAIHHE